MGRTACTEPQCLYKGDLYLFFTLQVELNNMYIYIECPRRNVPDFVRVFLMLKYTDITQNTYVQS